MSIWVDALRIRITAARCGANIMQLVLHEIPVVTNKGGVEILVAAAGKWIGLGSSYHHLDKILRKHG